MLSSDRLSLVPLIMLFRIWASAVGATADFGQAIAHEARFSPERAATILTGNLLGRLFENAKLDSRGAASVDANSDEILKLLRKVIREVGQSADVKFLTFDGEALQLELVEYVRREGLELAIDMESDPSLLFHILNLNFSLVLECMPFEAGSRASKYFSSRGDLAAMSVERPPVGAFHTIAGIVDVSKKAGDTNWRPK